ncbi:hypothetical protein KJK34_03375 [Flavobacterium sp. D11R37]|uniref:hypothetical protein n=1 Tax=Flavobacterium coralii TaxID=2838017 RepID=UPI001CA70A3C|nr:hypothetical protein [Flavobacterium coralii]MBY8961788.1 hypothetical protein [Flavobacterium coralii]
MKIWIYYEGYLSKMNLSPILSRLNYCDRDIIIFSSTSTSHFDKEKIRNSASIETFFKKSSKGDKLLTGIGTPGKVERELLSFCHRQKIKTIVLISDLGFDPIKLKTDQKYLVPDLLIFPDKITTQKFVSKLGSLNYISGGLPFLDNFYDLNVISRECSNTIGFFSVPIEYDQIHWTWPIEYTSQILLNDIMYAITDSDFESVRVRKHPKEEVYSEVGTVSNLRFESNDLEMIEYFILSNKLLISSYSTSIILAALLKKPSYSYQPDSKFIIREEIFDAIGIPIIKNRERIKKLIKEPNLSVNYDFDSIYNMGRATQYIMDQNILDI